MSKELYDKLPDHPGLIKNCDFFDKLRQKTVRVRYVLVECDKKKVMKVKHLLNESSGIGDCEMWAE